MKKWLYMVLESGAAGNRAARAFDTFMILLILANVAAFTLATLPGVAERYGPQLRAFDAVSILVFTIEYGLRLWVCTEHLPYQGKNPLVARLRFAATPAMIIDLLVIAPFYVALFTPSIDLRVLRIFRLLRLFKLMRYSPALDTLGNVLMSERRALLGSLVVMSGVLMVAATAIYLAEGQRPGSPFATIPGSMWWAITTLTTVGYGDVVPTTPLGRLIGGLVMILGLGMYALPIGIIATGFAQEIRRREFLVNWGMVTRVPLFRGLDPALVAEIMGILRTQVVPAGTVITHKGDPADAVYFVSSGSVDVVVGDRSVRLSEGEFFGEVSLLTGARSSITASAHTRCHLLLIEKHELASLLAHNEILATRLRRVAEERQAGRWEVSVADILDQEERMPVRDDGPGMP